MENIESVIQTQELTTTDGMDLLKKKMVEQIAITSSLKIIDHNDSTQVELVNTAKRGYQKARTATKKAFKNQRDIWTALSRDNLSTERELIGMFEAEEARLGGELDNHKLYRLRESNKPKLQARKQELETYNPDYDGSTTDEQLLRMTDKDFDQVIQSLKDAKLERLEREREETEREAEIQRREQEAAARAKAEAEVAAKMREEALIREAQKREENAKTEALAELARQEQEKLAEQERIANERAKAEKAKAFKKWQTDNGYDEATMILQHNEDGSVSMYKLISIYK